MKNECSIIRDILPLYIENMVSEETNEFIKEHLEKCPKCAAELEVMKAGTKVDELSAETKNTLESEVEKSLKSIRKKFRKKTFRVALVIAAIIAAVFITVSILLHFFPVYRLVHLQPAIYDDFFSEEQIKKALYIGSAADRREAQTVLRLADKAFSDVQHTSAENEEEYGLLARYATPTDGYKDAAFNEHSLELWSAHLGEDEGWIWVFFTSETFNHDGSLACGYARIPSLWKVEKNDLGEWVVVRIIEHP